MLIRGCMDTTKFQKSFKTRLLTGLFITFPLVLTLLAVKWLFVFLDGILGGTLDTLLGKHHPGLGFAISLLVVLGVGVLATTVLGRKFLDWTEKLMLSLPLIKSFYSTFKQLGDAFSPQNRAAFKKVVIVEYPRAGALTFGFLTKECSIQSDGGDIECYNSVYIPTNNLYLGNIAMFKKEDVIVTDITLEEGIKIILSAGIATPNFIERSKGDSTHPALLAPKVEGEAA